MVIFDYLIVGQGLAGSLLSYFLLKKGKKVLVVDEAKDTSASKVASGIVNPVTGRRMVKTWMADEVIPFAKETYNEIETLLGEPLFHEKPILRLLNSVKEENDALAKTAEEGLQNYLEVVSLDLEGVKTNFPQLLIKQGGWLDTGRFLLLWQRHLEHVNAFRPEKVSYRDIFLEHGRVKWRDIEAKKIIFCEGYKAAGNPFFELPFVPAKGEVLVFEAPGLSEDFILNKTISILPLGNSRFKAGATYEWKEPDEKVTESGRSFLEEKIREMVDAPIHIIAQQAAVRPTVKDRRPLLGIHKDYEQMAVFNGLGTKGTMLAPYFADHLVKHIEDGAPLLREVRIGR